MDSDNSIEIPDLKNDTRGGAREGAGRPQFEPNDEQRAKVNELAGVGVPLNQVAALIGINLETLNKYFRDDIVEGKGRANAKVGSTLFSKVLAGDTAAAIFWAKTQMRWSEVRKIEHTGDDGKPIEFSKIERVIVNAPD
jgi:hypothetical protein